MEGSEGLGRGKVKGGERENGEGEGKGNSALVVGGIGDPAHVRVCLPLRNPAYTSPAFTQTELQQDRKKSCLL